MLGKCEHRAAGVVRVCDAEHPGIEALVEDGLKKRRKNHLSFR